MKFAAPVSDNNYDVYLMMRRYLIIIFLCPVVDICFAQNVFNVLAGQWKIEEIKNKDHGNTITDNQFKSARIEFTKDGKYISTQLNSFGETEKHQGNYSLADDGKRIIYDNGEEATILSFYDSTFTLETSFADTIIFKRVSSIALAYRRYAATILSNMDKTIIPNATIVLKSSSERLLSDKSGRFILQVSDNPFDSLVISAADFETQTIALNKLPEDNIIRLDRKNTTLSEVIVGKKYDSHIVVLNDFSNCGMSSYTSSGSVTQVAQHFYNEQKGCMISGINICKKADDCKFNIRIYEMDPVSHGPGRELSDSLIEVHSSKRHKHIDLEPYKIIIPANDFFIAVEWILNEDNKQQTIYKTDGIKKTYIEYKPFIFVNSFDHLDSSLSKPTTATGVRASVFSEVWNYISDRAIWFAAPIDKLLISAEIRKVE